MKEKAILFSTCGSAEEAGRVARHLVESRVAACVNVVPGVRSIYRWKDAVEDAQEWLLVIKTQAGRLGDVQAALGEMHSYEVPELVAVPVTGGSADYLHWIDEQVTE